MQHSEKTCCRSL